VMGLGLTCPTKIADALDTKHLVLRGPEEALFLDNANTPEDHARAMSRSSAATATVEYFAVFRAQARKSSEAVSLDGTSLAGLYEKLKSRHGFVLGRESVHVAINDAYASWDAVLQPGDRLAFIPPVSGG
jgi:molybdopterin synthase sulfur carrier subunit